MTTRRRIKQGVYLGVFVAILFAIAVAGGLLITQPWNIATPTITPMPFDPIALERAVVIPHVRSTGAKTIDIVAQLRNPNARAGIGSYPITLTVTGSRGEELAVKQEETFLLPGALQYVVLTDIPIARQSTVSQVVVDMPDDPEFIEVPAEIPIPRFQTFLRERTTRTIGQEQIETQVGLVTNDSTFDWEEVQVTVVALDANRDIIATGKTFLGTLRAGEQREFSTQWPKGASQIQQVIAIPVTNMFSPENVVKTLGNPELLR